MIDTTPTAPGSDDTPTPAPAGVQDESVDDGSPQQPAVASGELARTGSNTGMIAVIGLSLVLLGSVLVLRSRAMA